jgi:hypothetical protein
MVTIIPKVESPGERFGKAIGGGFERGVQKGMDFATELAMEKYKRGLAAKQSLATLPPEYRQKLQGGESQGMATGQGMPSSPIAMGGEKQQFEDPASAARALEEFYRLQQSGQPADYRELYQKNLAQKQQVQALTKSFIDEAETALTNYDPKNTIIDPLTKARFAQTAKSNIYDKNLSEERKQTELRKEAVKLINSLKEVTKITPESRLGESLRKLSLGSLSSKDTEIKRIRNITDPLIAQGYGPEVKANLAKSGFGAEEIAYLTDELKPATAAEIKTTMPKTPALPKKLASAIPGVILSSFSKLPYATAKKIIDPEYKPTDDMLQSFNTGIENILANDPGANLVLLRREYEKNGIDWETFENKVLDMVREKKFVPTDSQQQDINVSLGKPPLDNLDRILYMFGLRGR